MPRFILALVLIAASAFAAVDLTKPIPALTLDDGRILKNATFANFKTDTVLVRHAGGALALRYEFLPEAVRADVQAKRPGGPLPAASSERAEWRIPQSQIKVLGEVLLTNDRMIPARTVQIESGP